MANGGGPSATARNSYAAVMTVTEEPPAGPYALSAGKKERWTLQWKELYDEVITSGLCTGCAGCVIACPHDVIGYEHAPGAYKPFHLEEELGLDNCIHGEKGCTSCTRACPRFRSWEPEADEHLFARVRQPDEPSGIYQDILLTRASDDMVHEVANHPLLAWCWPRPLVVAHRAQPAFELSLRQLNRLYRVHCGHPSTLHLRRKVVPPHRVADRT